MSGMIQGGWEFVWAAYGITFTTLSLYCFSLWLRLRADKNEP
jgi:heme exporter protein D